MKYIMLTLLFVSGLAMADTWYDPPTEFTGCVLDKERSLSVEFTCWTGTDSVYTYFDKKRSLMFANYRHGKGIWTLTLHDLINEYGATLDDEYSIKQKALKLTKSEYDRLFDKWLSRVKSAIK